MTLPFALSRPLDATFDDVTSRLPAALAKEGFGVLTHVDVQAVFAEKIGEDFRRYRIFGACNPRLAHRALSDTLLAGVMLPCNVAVWEDERGRATVASVDPTATPAAASEPAIAALADEVKARLTRVLDDLQHG